MRFNKCVTTLVFKDGEKKVKRTLEGFIQLKKGDFISLPNNVADSFDRVESTHSTHIKDNTIRQGAYEFRGVNRIYTERYERGFFGIFASEGCLEIQYFLSRLGN